MGVLFRYRGALISAEFNRRFSDLLGLNILYGFYGTKGTGNFDVSIHSGDHKTSLLFTKGGARIEQPETLLDVVSVQPNGMSIVRTDSLYVKYTHGKEDAIVEFVVVPGGVDGQESPLQNPLTHTLIGYINVPPNDAALTTQSFTHPNRGFHLIDVANEATFQEVTDFLKGLRVPAPESGPFATNKDYVDEWIETTTALFRKEDREVLEFSISSEDYDADNRVYRQTLLKRPDGTLHAKSTLSAKDALGDYKTLAVAYYDAAGTTILSSETWSLTYDQFGNVVSRTKG